MYNENCHFFRLRNKKGKIIFCGHSLGGAVASITAILTAKYIKKLKLDVNILRRLLTVTIGAPLFADYDVRKNWKDELRLQYHIVSVKELDLVPALLTCDHVKESLGKFDKFKSKRAKNLALRAVYRIASANWVENRVASWYSQTELLNNFRHCIAILENQSETHRYCSHGNFYFIGREDDIVGETNEHNADNSHNAEKCLKDIMSEFYSNFDDADKSDLIDQVLEGHQKDQYKLKIKKVFGHGVGKIPKREENFNHGKNHTMTPTTSTTTTIISTDFSKPHVESANVVKGQSDGIAYYVLELSGEYLHGIVMEKFKPNFEICRDNNTPKILENREFNKILLQFKLKNPDEFNNLEENERMEQMTIFTHFGDCKFTPIFKYEPIF